MLAHSARAAGVGLNEIHFQNENCPEFQGSFAGEYMSLLPLRMHLLTGLELIMRI